MKEVISIELDPDPDRHSALHNASSAAHGGFTE